MRDKYPHLATLTDSFRAIGGKVTWIRDEATGQEWGNRADEWGNLVTPIHDPLSWANVKANPKLGKGRI